MNIIGIIPARGDSKGILHKNIKLLAGKPLIAYTIEAALKSKFLDRVIVSTDSKKIAKIAKEYGTEVPFLRPERLAKDATPIISVLKHAVRWLEKKENYSTDIVVTLQPTSPLRQTTDINRAVKKIIETGADSVVSVCQAKDNPYWMMMVRKDRIFPFMDSNKHYSRRQALPRLYMLNGAVYVTRIETLTKESKILSNNSRAIIMEQKNSLDIDDEMDFKLAELILNK